MSSESSIARRVCPSCGRAALVDATVFDRLGVCDACVKNMQDSVSTDLMPERGPSAFWQGPRSGSGLGAAFSALDELFNPAAARAQEQVRGDHERRIPTPSPGDDILRTRGIVIRTREEAPEHGPDPDA